MRTLAIPLLLLLALGAFPEAAAQDEDGPCGLPPEAKPQRIKGGESFPPLPLPATPLRRTERKRQPAPPVLVGKMTWGTHHSKVLEGGRKVGWYDWNTDPADMQRLLKFANSKLRIRYRHINVSPRNFSWDPTKVPVLYIQGRAAPSFDARTREDMRSFVLRGGSIWADACAGSEEFANAFRAEMARIFPDRPLRRLPPDHPLFRSSHKITRVKYSSAARAEQPDGFPVVEGIYVGCRTAVFLLPYDCSCAWDSFHARKGAKCIIGMDAMKLGINLVAYTVSYYNLGRFLSQRRAIDTDDDSLRGDFVFAQIRHSGHWDPDPSGFANVLKETLSTTNVKMQFGRKQVPLTDPDLLSYPFLYVTGHGELRLSGEEADALKAFLQRGGFLLADACCGNLEFDRSFRAEMKRILGSELEDLPADHPVYSTFHRIEKVGYTPQVQVTMEGLQRPVLEGIRIGDDTRVIYSRFDLGNGWEGHDHPYAYGVAAPDARKLGVNVILYAMTH